VEVEDPEIISVRRVSANDLKAPVVAGSYSDVFAFNVTCLDVGESSFTLTVGNTKSSTNVSPIVSGREVRVKCDVPAKVVVKAFPRKAEIDSTEYFANPELGRVSG